jgi:HEAT repeat protein
VRCFACLTAIGLLFVAGGCGQVPATTAGGQPVSHWLEALHDPAAKVRKQAAQKLGNVGVTDPAAVPALIETLKDRDASVRAEVVLALLRIGPAAKEAVPALAEVQNDRDARVRSYAVQALEKIQQRR